MFQNTCKFIVIIAVIVFTSCRVTAETAERYVDYSAGYSHGEFNPGQAANLYQLEVTYGEVYEDSDFSVSVPYLYLKDELGKASGIGDVMLRAGTTLKKNPVDRNGFYGSVALKLPTASASMGLGTGEIDLGGFLSYAQAFDAVIITVMGGYIINGDSKTQSYADIFVYGLGLSKFISPWYVFSSLEGRQQVVNTSSNVLELNAGFFYQLRAKQFIKAEVYKGINSDTSDYGISAGFVNWF